MSGGWNITAPLLTEEQAARAVAPGGLSDGADPGDTSRGILLGLQRLPTIYGGTVPEHVVARRRKANKAARAARKVSRRRS